MKKFSVILILLLSVSIYGQAPDKMSYQAIIRNASEALVTNQNIGMQISILQSSINGSAVYVETQTVITNTNGLVNLEIGTGTATIGAFNAIDWSNGPYFIKIETDITGGTDYTITGTSQLQSVPYALYARTAGSANTVSQSNCGCSTYIIPYIPYGPNFAQVIIVSNTPAAWNGNTDSTDVTNTITVEAIDDEGNFYGPVQLAVNANSSALTTLQSAISTSLQDEGFDGSGSLALRFTFSNPENIYISANYRVLSANDRVFLNVECIK